MTKFIFFFKFQQFIFFIIPNNKIQSRVDLILLIEAICCSVSLPFLIFLRDRPKVPPNLAETVERPNFIKSFKILMKHPKYNLAMMAFGTMYGNAWDLFSILGNLMDSNKISNVH